MKIISSRWQFPSLNSLVYNINLRLLNSQLRLLLLRFVFEILNGQTLFKISYLVCISKWSLSVFGKLHESDCFTMNSIGKLELVRIVCVNMVLSVALL